jgi:hypothetical protein
MADASPRLPGFDALMHDVCVGHGYCGGLIDGRPAHVTDFIPATGPVSADQFVAWLAQAEGPDAGPMPETHRANLRAMFVRHMGAETADAAALRWDL